MIDPNVNKAGLDTQTAYNMALSAAQRSDTQQKLIDQNYSKVVKPGSNDNDRALQSTLAGAPSINAGYFHGGTPDIPPALKAEYNGLVKDYFDQTSDIDKARDLAGRAVLESGA